MSIANSLPMSHVEDNRCLGYLMTTKMRTIIILWPKDSKIMMVTNMRQILRMYKNEITDKCIILNKQFIFDIDQLDIYIF